MISFAFLYFALTVSTAAPARMLTVDEVKRHAWELDGKSITVRGWLPVCGGRDCSLYSSRVAAYRFREALGHEALLSIGHEPKFDAAIQDAVPAEIVLRARVNARCIDPRFRTDSNGNQVITVCADRADDLQPIELISIRRTPFRKRRQ